MGLMRMIHVANATYQAMCPNGCAVNCWGRNACTRWRIGRAMVRT